MAFTLIVKSKSKLIYCHFNLLLAIKYALDHPFVTLYYLLVFLISSLHFWIWKNNFQVLIFKGSTQRQFLTATILTLCVLSARRSQKFLSCNFCHRWYYICSKWYQYFVKELLLLRFCMAPLISSVYNAKNPNFFGFLN